MGAAISAHFAVSPQRRREEIDPQWAFAQVLREFRREQKLSQEKLAEIAGCTRPYVSYLERNLNTPSINMIFRLARALGTTPAEMMERVEKKLADGTA